MAERYEYLIIGGGMTAASAVKGIRDVDSSGTIGLISAEKHVPYDRPPLSKGLWKDKSVDKIWRQIEDQAVTLHLGREVISVDPSEKSVQDDQGNVYEYDIMLLATGGTPRTLPVESERIIYYRTLDDYRVLREMTGEEKHFAVIGGGFIGSEIAAGLAMNDQDVVIIFPEPGIGWRMYPEGLSRFINDYYADKGVKVIAGEMVSEVKDQGNQTLVNTESGKEFVVDAVVAGIGIIPNTKLAQSIGLKLDNGIVVDRILATSNPHIYAAGDVASYYLPELDQFIRVEHEDNANTMGEAAGRNMARQSHGMQPFEYRYLPFFYSDLFELGYEAVGELNSEYEMVEDWESQYEKGVVYYLKDGRVRGVLLWNVWGQVDEARKLIAAQGPFMADDLKGRLPA
jgi:3-phenylpropionate/trans-cinnamate dioxygenase ferredoxin reductase subunit